MWLSTGPSATGSGGVPAPIEPRMKKLASILLTAMLQAPLAALHAANFHVATTGNDSNPGTQTAPLNFE